MRSNTSCPNLLSPPSSRESSAVSSRPTGSARPSPMPPHKRRKKQAVDFDEALFSHLTKVTSEKDEADSFGEHVAARLRSFTPRQRALACLEIDKVLFNIEFPPPIPPTSVASIPPTPYIPILTPVI